MAAPKSKPPADRSPVVAANNLVTVLSAFTSTRLAPGARLCVALSGGRDSVVLLHALSQLASVGNTPFSLSAIHVHHGISPNADAWAEFCAEFCRRCAVPLAIVEVEVPRNSGEGLEAAARRMRHAAFADCSADWLALAHHRDDQAETVLLNLLRGAGIAGAAGMLAERPQVSGPGLIRPLLDVPRSVLEDYAAQHALTWIDDESNDDQHFRRNFLRHQIMPSLDEKFPGAQKSLARAAGHFAEGAMLLDDLAVIDRAVLATPSGRLGLCGFNALPEARARNLLRFEWVAAGFRAPDTRWLGEAMHQLATADALSEISVSTQDGALHVYRGELHFVAHRVDQRLEPLPWSGEAEVQWAGEKLLFLPTTGSGIRRSLLLAGEAFIKPRQGGERLQPHIKRPRRSLRNLLQEAAIPPWERARLPFLWSSGRLAWVAGLGVDASFSCAQDEEGVLPVWALR